jgi:hypothetical protein
MHWNFPNTFNLEFPGPDNYLSDLIKVCSFNPLKSLSEITVTSAPGVYFKVKFFVVNTEFLCPGFVKFIVNCSKKSFVLLFIYGNGSSGLVGRTTFCEMSHVWALKAFHSFCWAIVSWMVLAMSTSPTSCSFLLVEGLLWSRHRLSFPLIYRLRLYGIDSRITQIVPH